MMFDNIDFWESRNASVWEDGEGNLVQINWYLEGEDDTNGCVLVNHVVVYYAH